MVIEGISEAELFTAIALISLWVIPWKGYALWLAARNYHKTWFIVLLVLNTLAIADIIYIFAIGRPAYKKMQSEGEEISAPQKTE